MTKAKNLNHYLQEKYKEDIRRKMASRIKPWSTWDKCKAGPPAIISFLSQAIQATLCVESCGIEMEILIN